MVKRLSSEMSANFYQTIWHHSPDTRQYHDHKNEKSDQILFIYLGFIRSVYRRLRGPQSRSGSKFLAPAGNQTSIPRSSSAHPRHIADLSRVVPKLLCISRKRAFLTSRHNCCQSIDYTPYATHRRAFTETCRLLSSVHLLYEPMYVIPFVGNLTEERSYVSLFEFPSAYEYRKCVENRI
jgi:hypothetical protein